MSLAQAALTEKVTTPRYKLPVSREDVTTLLTYAYAQEVACRGFVLSPDDETTKSNIDKVSRWLTSDDTKPMLLLYGGVGNGKTTMAKAVIRLCITLSSTMRDLSNKIRDDKESHRLYIQSGNIRIPRMYTAQDLAKKAQSNPDELEKIANARFLIIDDLGCEPAVVKNYGTEVTPITDIIYKRYEEMSPLIVTTNLTKADIRNIYGARVADRFNEVFDTIGYTSASYRK